jgi:ribosomal protein L7/L12
MDTLLLVALGIAVVGLGLLLAALAGRDRRDDRAARQLAAVERKLDAVMEHLGVTLPEPEFPAVVEQLDKNNKIAAIKEYRKATGAGLKEAKNAVERIASERSAGKPYAAPAPAPQPSPGE